MCRNTWYQKTSIVREFFENTYKILLFEIHKYYTFFAALQFISALYKIKLVKKSKCRNNRTKKTKLKNTPLFIKIAKMSRLL